MDMVEAKLRATLVDSVPELKGEWVIASDARRDYVGQVYPFTDASKPSQVKLINAWQLAVQIINEKGEDPKLPPNPRANMMWALPLFFAIDDEMNEIILEAPTIIPVRGEHFRKRIATAIAYGNSLRDEDRKANGYNRVELVHSGT